MKNNFYYQNFKKSLNTSLSKIIFVCLVVVSFYSILSCGFEMSYIDKMIESITYSYSVVLLLLIMFLSTFNIFKIIDENRFYIIRCRNKKKYIYELIRNVVFINTVIFLIYLLLIIIFNNLLTNNLEFQMIENYNVNNLLYLSFLIIRNYFLMMIISIIDILLFKLFNSKIIVLILKFILLIMIILFPKTAVEIDNIIKMPLFIGDFLTITYYNSFALEISATSVYIVTFIIIVDILKNIIYKNIKKVGD